jgi:hypothetical protein
MKSRKALIAIGTTMILGTPLAALADVTWVTTYDEAGSQIVITRDDPATTRVAPAATKAPSPGDISPDRQYVFMGEEGGWQLRPMEYRFQGGRLVHVDDPAGHMDRLADKTPLTEQQRITLDRSAGS